MFAIIFAVGTTWLLFAKPSSCVPQLGTVSKSVSPVAELVKQSINLGIHFGTERTVIVRNDASDWLRLWCASADDNIGEQRMNPGESISFSFKPAGETVFWCTADYKTYWARWDVFGHNARYGHENDGDKAFVYEIRNDGVYYKDTKIRGLDSGRHRYVLWEHYDSNKNPHGASLAGHVDGGMCNNIPGWMEWKTSSVTVCDNQCVILYSYLHCNGQTSRLQAQGGCSNFWLSYFNDKARSVKGC